jgi:hypothetical protein
MITDGVPSKRLPRNPVVSCTVDLIDGDGTVPLLQDEGVPYDRDRGAFAGIQDGVVPEQRFALKVARKV